MQFKTAAFSLLAAFAALPSLVDARIVSITAPAKVKRNEYFALKFNVSAASRVIDGIPYQIFILRPRTTPNRILTI